MSSPTPQFGTLISETGAGFTWYGNSQRNRLTQWSNDPVLDPHSEIIYIRDEESGQFWNPTAGPIRERDAYRISHGAGYSRFEHNSHAIEELLTVFVPRDQAVVNRLRSVSSPSETTRKKPVNSVLLTMWNGPIGEHREATQQHIVTAMGTETGFNPGPERLPPRLWGSSRIYCHQPSTRFLPCDRTVFLGRNQTSENPAAMRRTRLAERIRRRTRPLRCAADKY